PQLSFAHPGAGHPTGSSLAELLRQPPARFHQLVEIDAGFDAHALQHICDVFAGHVAGRAFCVGAAAGTGDRTVHHAYTFFEAHEDVRKRLVVGVMEVHGQRLHRDFVRHRVQHCAGFHRRTDTDGIAQRNFVAAKLVQAFRNTHHIADGHLALIWAAEYGGHVAAHPNAFGAGALQHRAEPFDGFVDRGVDVLLVEGFAGGREYRNAGDARLARAVVAAHVGHQRRVIDPGFAIDTGIDFLSVRELRHPLRADETGRLDGLQATRRKAIDQFDLDRRRYHGLFVLQAVAGANFNDADMIGKHARAGSSNRWGRWEMMPKRVDCKRRAGTVPGHSSLNLISTVSASTKSPAAAPTCSTIPARGAFSDNSIFIASITSNS